MIVTSCGTSLLTNGAKQAERRQLIEAANVRSQNRDQAAEALVERLTADVRMALEAGNAETARSRSAEINSLVAFEQETSAGEWQEGDHHILVHSDTLQGEATAKLVKDWLEQGGRVVQLMSAPGLRTTDIDEFSLALSDLAKQLVDQIPGWRASGASIHFNLTGGFKGMQGFLQALGFVLADEVLYLFEGSRSLLRIPRLPLTLAGDDALMAHLDLFRRLSLVDTLPLEAVRDLPETLVDIIGDEAQLSAWGHMLSARLIDTARHESLMESLSEKLVLTRRFHRDVAGLPPERLALINHQLDNLAAYLEGWLPWVRSLSFKPISGNLVPGCSHELYAWSDKDAKRIFGHYLEDRRFCVDRLGGHL